MTDEQNERIVTYRLLAGLLKAPVDQAMLVSLAMLEQPSDIEPNALTKAWQNIIRTAADADAEKLNDEFHRLFIGLGRGELLPYRSFYETGFLMEKPLAQLREDLLKLGFQRREGNKEPEDYLPSLFEVMALLIAENHSSQSGFFNRHIASWGGQFFKDMQVASDISFYRESAKLGQAFLQSEKEINKL